MNLLTLLIDTPMPFYGYATVVYSDDTAMTVELYSNLIILNTTYNRLLCICMLYQSKLLLLLMQLLLYHKKLLLLLYTLLLTDAVTAITVIPQTQDLIFVVAVVTTLSTVDTSSLSVIFSAIVTICSHYYSM